MRNRLRASRIGQVALTTVIAIVVGIVGVTVFNIYTLFTRQSAICHAFQNYEQRNYNFQVETRTKFSDPKQLVLIAKNFGLTLQELKDVQRDTLKQLKPESCKTILHFTKKPTSKVGTSDSSQTPRHSNP